MANKIQIRKFLECKRDEAICKLNKESEQMQEDVKNKFFDTYKDDFEKIKNQTIKIGVEYDSLIKKFHDAGIAHSIQRYTTPSYLFNELCGKLSISNLYEYYIVVDEATKIANEYKTKVNSTETEYNNLIAVCQSNAAKDSILILENLGFNTSEIEVKKEECTTLITNIDSKKLFV